MRLLFITILIAGLTGCSEAIQTQQSEPIKISLTSQEILIVDNSNVFTFKLLKDVYCDRSNADKNIMVSPYSLASALALTSNGANGATKDSIIKSLGYEGFSQIELNTLFKKITSAIKITDPSSKIAIANSVWYRQGYSVKKAFENSAKEFFGAEVYELDFDSDLSVGVINKWSSDNTFGKINKVLESISPDYVMFILNSVYFNSLWAKGFEFDASKTSNLQFNTLNSGSLSVPFMRSDKKYDFVTTDKLLGIKIPYGNGSFEFIALIPSSTNSVEGMISDLQNRTYYNSVISSFSNGNVTLSLPKFKYRFDCDLRNTLNNMGMGIALDPDNADFSNLFNSADNFYISMVKQFNYIDLNEKGTEAASVTVIGIGVTSMPINTVIDFNKPFIYLIREKSTGTILFSGVILNPSLS